MKNYQLTELPAAIILIIASAISTIKTRTGLVEKLNQLSGGFAELLMDTVSDMALGSHEGFTAEEVAVYQGMGTGIAQAVLKAITPDNDLSKDSLKTAVESLDFQTILEPLMEGLTDAELEKINGVMMKIKGFIGQGDAVEAAGVNTDTEDEEIVIVSRMLSDQEASKEDLDDRDISTLPLNELTVNEWEKEYPRRIAVSCARV
jgi:hypothetical protein